MASAYLTRTVTASTATSYTVSFWVKINDVGNTNTPYFWSIGSSAGNGIYFDSDAKIDFFKQSTSSYLTLYDGVLRDPSAWYHIVWSVNAGTGTAYVNGVTGNSHSSIPALNDNTGTKINIHSYVTGAYNTLDCCMAHFHFIDGTAYNADTFGETDSTSGIWKPKTSPSVTYGTNGFFLKMENSSDMGEDSSGNNNDFTTSGTITQNVDSPSHNFATLNPLQSNLTLTNGNTAATTTNYKYAVSTMAVNSGKYYFEMKVTHGCMIIGIQDMIKANDGIDNTAIFWSSGSESYHLDGFSRFTHDSYGDISTSSTEYPTYGSGDIVMMALDLDNNKLAYGKNGTWYNSTNPSSGTTNMVSIDAPSTLTSGFYGIVCADTCGASDGTFYVNFGNGYFGTTKITSEGTNASGIGKFEYDVPTGYTALSTKGLNE